MILFLTLVVMKSQAQVELDLANKIGNTQGIDLDVKFVSLINCVRLNNYYIVDVEKKTVPVPPFDLSGLKATPFDISTCTNEFQTAIIKIRNEKSEEQQKINVAAAQGSIKLKSEKKDDCISALLTEIGSTKVPVLIPFRLTYNQIITITVNKFDKTNNTKVASWTFILKTEEKTRWLIHYGLTYAPSLINKTDRYFSQADTGVANKYTVTKENDNGPKPWDNISATINFTYPFHSDNRNFDGGFTAGFGLTSGFELSGHAGFLTIIGENVIIGTGVAFMQKYKLMGSYKENQVVKTNLNFDALHHKVWLPELYFTIGFRFNGNPFVKKATDDNTTKPADDTK